MKDESFPSIPQALLLVLSVFLVEYVVGLALYDARRSLALSQAELAALVTLLGNGVVFATLLHAKEMPYRDLFHPSVASVRATFLFLVPPVALLIPALILVITVANRMLIGVLPLSVREEQLFQGMASTSIANTVTVCVLAPILEEMLFRGIILRAFLQRYSRGTAIGASALIFGVAHLNIYQFVIAFLLGTLAGWLYERSRSLVAPIALHGFYNTAVTYLAASMAGPAASVGLGTWALAAGGGTMGALALSRVLVGRRG